MLKIIACTLLIAPSAWACRRFGVRLDPWAAGLALAFAVFQAVGHSYESFGTCRAIFSEPSETAYALATLVLCGACFWLGLSLVFRAMDRAGAKAAARTKAPSAEGEDRLPRALQGRGDAAPSPRRPALAFPGVSGARFALCVAAVLLLAWLPYLVVFAPGSFTYDGTNQMDVFYGFLPKTDHHPYLMTLLMGSFFDVGRQLGSDSLGVALWVAFQTAVQACALSLSVASMRRMGAPRSILAAAVAFFALAPAWGAYAQAFLKDTLFASLFCLYVTMAAEAWLRNRRGLPFSARQLALAAALCLLLCVTRHNGLFVIVLSAPFFILAVKGRRARLQSASVALAAVLSFALVSAALLPALGVVPAGKQETLGALFQQTARYLKECPDDVTPEERDAVAAVLDYGSLAGLYKGSMSDPVKATYTGDEAALPAYFRAWASMGARHPGIYLDAFLNGMYGYLYVDASSPHDTWDYRFYNYGPLPGVPDDFEVDYAFGEGVRGAVISACNVWQGIPLLGLTGHCGVYSWALLAACAYLLRMRQPRLLFIAAPTLVMLLICFVSPVNGYLRYMLPIMAVVPLTLWFAVYACAKGRECHCRHAGI